MDFARSSRDRATTDPAFSAGGISFIALGGDAVTYATFPGSNAPANLTTAQLFKIYTCAVHQLEAGRRQERARSRPSSRRPGPAPGRSS